MHTFTPVASTLGGLLVGVAASLLFAADGRILGISGILGALPFAHGDRAWRALFLLGLAVGGVLVALLSPGRLALASEQTTAIAVVSGALVGYGTRLGNGCTSGHGLCGIARFSRRSIVATVVFVATGMATVFVVRHVLGAGREGASWRSCPACSSRWVSRSRG